MHLYVDITSPHLICVLETCLPWNKSQLYFDLVGKFLFEKGEDKKKRKKLSVFVKKVSDVVDSI